MEAMDLEGTPPIAAYIDDGAHLGELAWSDEFLALGSHLRAACGTGVTFVENVPAYEVTVGTTPVMVTITDLDGVGSVRASAWVRDGDAWLIEWALRRNHSLSLAHLELVGSGLVVAHDLHLDAARGPVLAITIGAVAAAARTIRREIESDPTGSGGATPCHATPRPDAVRSRTA
jgi:hypothetical protein